MAGAAFDDSFVGEHQQDGPFSFAIRANNRGPGYVAFILWAGENGESLSVGILNRFAAPAELRLAAQACVTGLNACGIERWTKKVDHA